MRCKRSTFDFFASVMCAAAFVCLFVLPLSTLSQTSSGSVVDLDGKPIDPQKAAQGKVTVLAFVRTDCPVSNRYAPTIQKLSSKYAGKAVFWLVYPDKKESADTIRKHDAEFGYKIAALRDPQRVLTKESQVKITPEVAVFDANGQLVYHGRIDNWYMDFGQARSAPTTHELDDAIQAALDGKMPAVRATDAVGCYISDLE